MMDVDLVRGADLLGLDRIAGLSFLRKVFAKKSPKFLIDRDRFDFVKKVVACLSSMAEKIERAEQEIPDKLQVQLTNGLVRFLRNSYITMYASGSPLAAEVQKLLITFFNENHLILNLVKAHFNFTSFDDWRFAGGKKKLEFLFWCADEGLRLDEKQLAEFISADFRTPSSTMSKICEKIGLEVKEAEKNKSS